jgi:hypothetical protein
MKNNLLPTIIFSALILSSCTISRDARISFHPDSQKLLAKQEMFAPATSQKPEAYQKVEPETCETNNASGSGTVKPAYAKDNQSISRISSVKQTVQVLAQSITLSNLQKKEQNFLNEHKAAASVSRAGHESEWDYFKLWVICGVAAIIFLLLSYAPIHLFRLFSSICIILALIAFIGFLIFLGLQLWQLHENLKSKK